jgi:hypothetical protein
MQEGGADQNAKWVPAVMTVTTPKCKLGASDIGATRAFVTKREV